VAQREGKEKGERVIGSAVGGWRLQARVDMSGVAKGREEGGAAISGVQAAPAGGWVAFWQRLGHAAIGESGGCVVKGRGFGLDGYGEEREGEGERGDERWRRGRRQGFPARVRERKREKGRGYGFLELGLIERGRR